MMNVSFTAYLPETDTYQKRPSYLPENLRNYSRLLDKQTIKLNYLDSECMKNWDKCNRFYLSSQNRESRLSNKLKETKRTLRSQSDANIEQKNRYTKKNFKFDKSRVFSNLSHLDHLIISDDDCSTQFENSSQVLKYKNYISDFNLTASPILYQNENSRLSFLLSLNFDSLVDIETSAEFEGYHLRFVDNDKLSSCVKILPDKSVRNKLVTELNFIKDKFYFILLKRTIQFVIKDPGFISQRNFNFTFFFANVSLTPFIKCKKKPGYCLLENVNSGILSVGIKSKNKSIDTSKPFHTDLCKGDFNHYTCILRHRSNDGSYFIIMQPGTNQFEYILGNINRLRLKNNDSFIIARDEIWPNNIVYKLYQTKSQIFYLGEFRNPSKINICRENTKNKLCPCENECKQCSSKTGSEKIIRAVVLEEELESKHCTEGFYSAYDFKNIPITNSFMNQKLNNHRKEYNKKDILKRQINMYEYNMDFMPKLCLETVDVRENFFIYLYLNNAFSASMTNLFRFKNFLFSLYEIKSKIGLNLHSIDSKTLFDANLVPFFNISLAFNQKFVRIPINDKKIFLIEFKAESNNSICPKQNMCVDESPINNQVQCIHNEYCPKWLYLVKLSRKINATKCGVDERALLSKSLGEMLIELDMKNSDMKLIHFYGIRVPNKFKIKNLKLPINFLDSNLTNTDHHHNIKDIGPLFIILIVFLIFFSIFFIFIYYQSILISLFRIESTNIVFYLSINISLENQKVLNNVVEKLVYVLKAWFQSFKIDLIKYDTTNRQELIKNADLIVYVSATEQEILDIEKNTLKIGQNYFHDEFNQIHFLNSRKFKCIDIALLSEYPEMSQRIKKKKKRKDIYKHKGIPLVETSSLKNVRKVFKLPQESKNFLIEIKSRIESKKECHLKTNCTANIIKQSQKFMFNLILCLINCRYKKLLREKKIDKMFEQVNYDYFNSINSFDFSKNNEITSM